MQTQEEWREERRKKVSGCKGDIMTPGHERWREFCNKLGGPGYCNFREPEPEKYIWDCNGGNDKTFAIQLLSEMGDFDIDATLAFFELNGGHCDCEILFNVAD